MHILRFIFKVFAWNILHAGSETGIHINISDIYVILLKKVDSVSIWLFVYGVKRAFNLSHNAKSYTYFVKMRLDRFSC